LKFWQLRYENFKRFHADEGWNVAETGVCGGFVRPILY
jgi:hypothetical protein